MLSFKKANFNQDDILNSANSLKYIKAIRNEFEKELENPSDEFTKLLAKRSFEGVINAKRLESFKEYLSSAIKSSISDMINNRLQSALNKEDEVQKNEIEITDSKEVSKIITTEEEIEAYQIVKAILREKIPSNKIVHRDTQSYFGILFDNNNRKPICRMYLDSSQKRIGVFDENKNETKHDIESVDDIYQYKNQLIEVASFYN